VVKHYTLGAVVRIKFEVRVDGVLTTPTSPVVRIRKPDGTLLGPFTPVTDSTGMLHYDYTIGTTTPEVGTYYARLEGSGAGAGAGETAFIADRSAVL
jgi:hypothetical protein